MTKNMTGQMTDSEDDEEDRWTEKMTAMTTNGYVTKKMTVETDRQRRC